MTTDDLRELFLKWLVRRGKNDALAKRAAAATAAVEDEASGLRRDLQRARERDPLDHLIRDLRGGQRGNNT